MSNSIDLSGILGKKFTLTGIPSPAHPDGGSYEIPSLSAQDGAKAPSPEPTPPRRWWSSAVTPTATRST
jgi:hypothetical protein